MKDWMKVFPAVMLAACLATGCVTNGTVAQMAEADKVYRAPVQEAQSLRILVGGKTMVMVYQDGRIRFGPEYSPDETARIFWKYMEQQLGGLFLSEQNVKTLAVSGALCALYGHNVNELGQCILCKFTPVVDGGDG